MVSLDYLFTSYHKDGQYIVQTQDDKSSKVEFRNAFFDVLEETRVGNPPVMFCLTSQFTNPENKVLTYLVDLRNGVFVINDAPVVLHTEPGLTNFRLIFYKTRKEHFNVHWNQLGSETIYHLGWQANDANGNNVQRIINIY